MLSKLELGRATQRAADALDDLVHAPHRHLADIGFECAQRALQINAVWHDIACAAAVNRSNCDDTGFERIHIARDHRLQRRDNLRRSQHGVFAKMG